MACSLNGNHIVKYFKATHLQRNSHLPPIYYSFPIALRLAYPYSYSFLPLISPSSQEIILFLSWVFVILMFSLDNFDNRSHFKPYL
jgi:hypothetical protein